MKIYIAKNNLEYKYCFEFIKNMWLEEFDINFEEYLEQRYKKFLESDIYYIKENWKIIAVIQLKKWFNFENWVNFEKNNYFIWRLWVDKKFRKKWYWTELINFWINKIKNTKIKTIYIWAEINNINYYSKFGFKKLSNKQKKAWNTSLVYMEKRM